MDLERSAALKEVDKPKNIGFTCDALYLKWLSNPLLVRKGNEERRTYIDWSDLNKVNAKDSFPLSRINQLVESTVGYELL